MRENARRSAGLVGAESFSAPKDPGAPISFAMGSAWDCSLFGSIVTEAVGRNPAIQVSGRRRSENESGWGVPVESGVPRFQKMTCVFQSAPGTPVEAAAGK